MLAAALIWVSTAVANNKLDSWAEAAVAWRLNYIPLGKSSGFLMEGDPLPKGAPQDVSLP